jgi:hypothetical protein
MGRDQRSYDAMCAEYDRLQTAVIELVRQIPTCAKCRESGADVLATRVSGLLGPALRATPGGGR